MKFTSALCLALAIAVASAEYDCSGVSSTFWRNHCTNICNNPGASHCPAPFCSGCVEQSEGGDSVTATEYTSWCDDDTIYHAVDDQYCDDNCNADEPFCPACCLPDGETPTPTPEAESDDGDSSSSYESFCEDDAAFYAADDDWCTNNCMSESYFCPDCCLPMGQTPTPTPAPASDDEEMTQYYANCDSDSVFHAIDDDYCTNNCNQAEPYCPSCCSTSNTGGDSSDDEDATPQYTSNCEGDYTSIYWAWNDAHCTSNCNAATPNCPDCCVMQSSAPN